MTEDFPLHGGCGCGAVRYALSSPPLIVHCCHCTWCQRETGSAFAVNALIEADRVAASGDLEKIHTPSASGKGQAVFRCAVCKVAVWSHYAGAGEGICFVRVGTLDVPGRLPPDIHIFTSSKLSWVTLPEDTPSVPEYYKTRDQWPAASLSRLEALQK